MLVMRGFGPRRGLLLVAATLVLLLLGALAGGALAAKTDRYSPVNLSITRHVVDPAGDETPTDLILATLGGIDV
jgi:hypothetical protein